MKPNRVQYRGAQFLLLMETSPEGNTLVTWVSDQDPYSDPSLTDYIQVTVDLSPSTMFKAMAMVNGLPSTMPTATALTETLRSGEGEREKLLL